MPIAKNKRFWILVAVACLTILTSANLTKIQDFFGINRAYTQEKAIALTYDDGPYPPYTNQLLTVLDRYGVKATFYEIGKNIEKHPDIVKLTLAKGHELANHSYSHQSMVFKSPAFLTSEIEKTDKLLQQLGNPQKTTFRPPWGRRLIALPYLLAKMHKKLIMWDVNSEDYVKSHTPEIIANLVIQGVRPGSIVLLHDGGGDRSKTVLATEIIINKLKAKGYTFKTVSDLLSNQ